MKSHKARNANKHTNELKNQQRFNIKVTPADVMRLGQHGFWYEEEDIARVANYIFTTHHYNIEQQFKVVCSIEQLIKFLKQPNCVAVNPSPICIIYNKGGNHWVTFCIIDVGNQVVVLFKDSSGDEISDNLKNTIKSCFSSVLFKSHNTQEQIDGSSCGPMALRNMEIILQGVKDNAIEFVKGFEKTTFCSENEVEHVKQTFVKYLQEILGQKLANDLFDLTQDEQFQEFKKYLNECLDTCSNLARATEPMKEYHKVLQNVIQQEDANYEMNTDMLSEARSKFLKHDEIKKIIEEETNIKQNTNIGESDAGAGEKNKFLVLMQKFNDIFDIFDQSEADENLITTLRDVCAELGIEYEKIKMFFEIKMKKEELNEEVKKPVIKPKNINKIKDDLPTFQCNRVPGMRTSDKTLEQILSELVLNVNEQSDTESTRLDQESASKLSKKSLRKYYKRKYENCEDIKQLEKNFHEVKKLYRNWKDKSVEDILCWAKDKRANKLLETEIHEAVAVMDRANAFVTGGNRIRHTQILSVLIFIQSKENRGRLCQISTGEGKTTIVSVLATLKVLQGKTVDVITSNQILAENGVKDRESFYGLFDISVATNNIDPLYKQGARPCYTADIVYGSIGNFQFDYLKDSFEGLETRDKRDFSCVILDEVDSMLVDNGGYIAKLAGPFPGIDYLKYVYIKIWQELRKAGDKLNTDFETSLGAKADELWRKKETGIPDEQLQLEYENHIAELLKQQVDKLKEIIKASKPADIELIPFHLKEHARDMVDKWIDNAIYAKYQCIENEQYVIKKNQDGGEDMIVPVDYENTGVTMKNTIWSNALHQFVQLKHNLHLTSESFTSSYISNIGYIKLYNNNILGLTGTLGSVAEQNLLSSVYDVDFARIPTYKPKNFVEIEGLVVRNNDWIDMVALGSLILTYQGRSVLIICKTIRELQDLKRNIEALKTLEEFVQLKIKIYADEEGSHIVEEEVGVGEIIIATNIAGRGTDFKTCSELEENGGLHVFTSFLPVNQRVEDQAFGRTSRQGNAGTGQLIVKESDVVELGVKITPGMQFEAIKKGRDDIEKLRLEKIRTEELPEIAFQDSIFSKFSRLYRELKNKAQNNPGDMFVRKDLKEYWAFWLQKKNFKNLDLKEVDGEFEGFKEAARIIIKGNITQNPYYSILQAEHFLSNSEIDKAKTALKHAVDLSDEHAELLYSAHLIAFEIAIETGDQLRERFNKAVKDVLFISGFKKDTQYAAEALAALGAAKKALEKEIDYLERYFIGRPNDKRDEECDSNVATGENADGEPADNADGEPADNADGERADNADGEPADNADFIAILTHSEDNLLFKHIKSRFLILKTFHEHVMSLSSAIKKAKVDENKGIVIDARIPNYLANLDPRTEDERKFKEAITNSELSELSLVGLDTIYVMREVHDVADEVIFMAKAQMRGGLSVLALGVTFPYLMSAIGPIASTLITEGICDIVMELMSQGRSEFDCNARAAYIKGKCINYGIAALTMGVGAILKCTTVLDRAIKACKALANTLKNCKMFGCVCKKLATLVEELVIYLEKSKLLIEINRLNKADRIRKLTMLKSTDPKKLRWLVGTEKFNQLQKLHECGKLEIALSRFQILTKQLGAIGKSTLKCVVGSIISEKIVTKGLEAILQNQKPNIEKAVESTINKELQQEQLELVGKEVIDKILIGTYGEIATDVLIEIAFGILRQCNNWKVKISSLAIDSGISIVGIYRYSGNFCRKLKELLKNREPDRTKRISDNSDEVKAYIIAQVTEKVYGLIIHLAGKYAQTILVNPIMHKVWNVCEGVINEQESTSEEHVINSFYEIVEAHETLGVDVGASIDDIAKAHKKLVFETHPNRNHGDSEANAKCSKVNSAFALINDLHNKIPPPKPMSLPDHNTGQPYSSGIDTNVELVDNGLGEAHIAHIRTLSRMKRQCIIVWNHNSGETIQTFGGMYSEKPPMFASYSSPTDNSPGHYSLPEDVIESIRAETGDVPVVHPSYQNNCFYDVLESQFRARSGNETAQELREIAETLSVDNLCYDTLTSISQLFNNQITRSVFLKVNSSLLVGGRVSKDAKPFKGRRFEGKYYPSHENRIESHEALKNPVAALRNKLNELMTIAEEFDANCGSSQRQYIKHNKSKLCFTVTNKKEMMLGAILVNFTDGSSVKLMTVSGTTPFFARISISEGNDMTHTKVPVPFTWKHDGFQFVDRGDVTGKLIYDVYNRKELTVKYNKWCTAQKLLYELGEHMKVHSELKIEGTIKMVETWYNPGAKGKFTPAQVVVRASCDDCVKVLPFATGKSPFLYI